MALKEQDVVFTTKDANGNTVIQMPITRVENVEGAVKTVNGAGPNASGNVSVPDMSAATADAAGSAGLVPAPAAGSQGKYLRGDGTWQTPPDTKYTHPNSGVAAGTYNNVTVNAQGHVTAGSNTTFAKVATSGSYNDLSNKPTIPATPKAYVTESWSSGTSWYRKYSDGWIEQGGYVANNGGSVNVTFPLAFSNTNYTLVGGYLSSSVGSSMQQREVAIATGRSNTGFSCQTPSSGYGIGKSWYACGY